VPVAVLPTAKSLSAFSLEPQSDSLLERKIPKRKMFAHVNSVDDGGIALT
jgi:hypothetical protein